MHQINYQGAAKAGMEDNPLTNAFLGYHQPRALYVMRSNCFKQFKTKATQDIS